MQALVEEKETRAKETMYIMGLKAWVFSISWATTYLVRILFSGLENGAISSLNEVPSIFRV